MPSCRALRQPILFVLPGLFLLSTGISAQTTQQAIEARLKDHPLYLRGLWPQNRLRFDITGSTKTPIGDAPFTLSGIDVEDVQINNDRLSIVGERVGVEFMPGGPQRVTLHDKIKIDIAGSPGADYGPALDKIFADGLADLVPTMPVYWQRFAQRALVDPSERKADPHDDAMSGPHPHALEGVPDPNARPPKSLHLFEPEFTEAARRLRYTGTVRVMFIVDTDGTVKRPYIIRALGLGLDEQAIACVSKYRFQPAMEDGNRPVPVELMVEVNFQIIR